MDIAAQNGPGASATERDARWAAVVARDPQADGTFSYAGETTGVYCRPSCAARLPKPEHGRFHATCGDAAHAGFRPCKRCTPHQISLVEQQAATSAASCRLIEQAEGTPSLAQLAQQAGCSPAHFHRVCKAITGLTPQAYAAAQRAKRVRSALGTCGTVTEAMVRRRVSLQRAILRHRT
jgi:AraC family transcriptional regulator, regulatory protein of adaptative response / methylated-DNA-[protein]-cysteine methyltransferase